MTNQHSVEIHKYISDKIAAATHQQKKAEAANDTAACQYYAGQLYELLASSLPAKVRTALNRERQATTYLVSLPHNTRREIGRLSDQFAATGGSIVVGRKVGVTYEP